MYITDISNGILTIIQRYIQGILKANTVNTGYFQDILKRDIYILYIYIHGQTGILQVYYRYITGISNGIFEVY